MMILMVFLYQERSLVRKNFASSRVTLKCYNVVFIFTGTTRNIVLNLLVDFLKFRHKFIFLSLLYRGTKIGYF